MTGMQQGDFAKPDEVRSFGNGGAGDYAAQ
jgi:hypothetical protein